MIAGDVAVLLVSTSGFGVGDEVTVIEVGPATSLVESCTYRAWVPNLSLYLRRDPLTRREEAMVCRPTQTKGRPTTLPTDSEERKGVPLNDGVLKYFPWALAEVAKLSKAGNDKHNPGEPLHHARSKSKDHADCILRHLMDLNDLLARDEREDPDQASDRIREEVASLCWRALALAQQIGETHFGAPLAPGAKE